VHAAERADREADAARRLRLPSPTLFGGVKRADVDSDRQFAGVFGVSVSAPLFDRGNREATRWLAERGRLETERVWIERRIRSEVEAAFIAFELRRAAVMADQTAAGEELLQIAEVAYREGEMGILELLDAARTAWRSRIRSAELRLEARLAEIALERAVGEVLWL
ncbi:MAG: TolC family protein, partial [Vicinamibacterales bacterium]